MPVNRSLPTPRALLPRSLAALFLALAGVLIFGIAARAVAAQDQAPAAPTLDQDLEAFAKAPDRAPTDQIARLAKSGEAKYCRALLEALPNLGTDGARLRIAKQLWRMAGVGGVEQDAMQALLDLATNSEREEVSSAALDSLSKSARIGHQFLGMLVDSGAADHLRIGAMRRHVQGATAEDKAWYRQHWNDDEGGEDGKGGKKKKKEKELPPEEAKLPWKLGEIRALAFGALVSGLEMKDLEMAIVDPNGQVRSLAVKEVLSRQAPETEGLAVGVFNDAGQSSSVRAGAADYLMRQKGDAFVEELLDTALHFETSSATRDALAMVFAARATDEQKAKVAKKFGKGKPDELLFQIQALTGFGDDKLRTSLEKLLRDKNYDVRMAAIAELEKRAAAESAEPLAKALDKLDEPTELAAILRALTAVRGTDSGWAEQLRTFATGEAEQLRNAALDELVAQRDSKAAELLHTALGSPDWSTRLTAANGLEVLRLPESIGWLVDQLQSETGRIVREMSDVLFRLTGQPFNKNAGAWKAWYSRLEGPAKILTASELDDVIEEQRARSLDESTGTKFFGLRIESHRVTFVIDTSGSMEEKTRGPYAGMQGQPRIDAAKAELTKALDGLDPNALFNIIPFSDKARPWQKALQRSTPDVLEGAKGAVGKLIPTGGTNLFGGLEAALADPDVDTIIVLGDGEPSVGKLIEASAIRRWVAEQNKDRGVVIHTVRIGLDLPILQWLAEDSGGTSTFIP